MMEAFVSGYATIDKQHNQELRSTRGFHTSYILTWAGRWNIKIQVQIYFIRWTQNGFFIVDYKRGVWAKQKINQITTYS